MALGNPRIDFLSLDVEGSEMNILETIPFDKVDISVIMIEVAHFGKIFPGDVDRLLQFMDSKEYVFFRRLNVDDIYIKKQLMEQLMHIEP